VTADPTPAAPLRQPRYVGWYDRADQTEPTFDPGNVPCVVCHQPWTKDTVRTVCVTWQDRHVHQSLFYRMHRTCADSLTPKEVELYDGTVLDHAPYSLEAPDV
jgi:hypothetical protein